MDPLSLTSLSMADSYFNHLTSDNLIWKKLYKTDYPARHSKMIGLRDVLKHISWKDSYNADSKVQIELRWANQNCVPCIRWNEFQSTANDFITSLISRKLPLKCTCDRKTVQVKKYMEVYHIQYHVKELFATIIWDTVTPKPNFKSKLSIKYFCRKFRTEIKESICFFSKEAGYLSPRTPIKEIHTAGIVSFRIRGGWNFDPL